MTNYDHYTRNSISYLAGVGNESSEWLAIQRRAAVLELAELASWPDDPDDPMMIQAAKVQALTDIVTDAQHAMVRVVETAAQRMLAAADSGRSPVAMALHGVEGLSAAQGVATDAVVDGTRAIIEYLGDDSDAAAVRQYAGQMGQEIESFGALARTEIQRLAAVLADECPPQAPGAVSGYRSARTIELERRASVLYTVGINETGRELDDEL